MAASVLRNSARMTTHPMIPAAEEGYCPQDIHWHYPVTGLSALPSYYWLSLPLPFCLLQSQVGAAAAWPQNTTAQSTLIWISTLKSPTPPLSSGDNDNPIQIKYMSQSTVIPFWLLNHGGAADCWKARVLDQEIFEKLKSTQLHAL